METGWRCKKRIAAFSFCVFLSIQLNAQMLAVFGDYGNGGAGERSVAELVRRHNPDYIITTGDNNYPSGKASTIDQNIGQFYAAWIGSYKGAYGKGSEKNRFFPCIGNHDWMTWRGAPYKKYFDLPGNERYYDVILGNVHLFVLNSNKGEKHGTTENSRQAKWLREQLGKSDSRWKIVVMHHAPYVSDDLHGNSTWMQWPFKEWGATLVLSGHAHVYERSVVNGLTYIVSGLGGASSYPLAEKNAETLVQYNNKYGALFARAEENVLNLKFVTIDNEVIDTLTIYSR